MTTTSSLFKNISVLLFVEEEANISAGPSVLRGRILVLGLACLVGS